MCCFQWKEYNRLSLSPCPILKAQDDSSWWFSFQNFFPNLLLLFHWHKIRSPILTNLIHTNRTNYQGISQICKASQCLTQLLPSKIIKNKKQAMLCLSAQCAIISWFQRWGELCLCFGEDLFMLQGFLLVLGTGQNFLSSRTVLQELP